MFQGIPGCPEGVQGVSRGVPGTVPGLFLVLQIPFLASRLDFCNSLSQFMYGYYRALSASAAPTLWSELPQNVKGAAVVLMTLSI